MKANRAVIGRCPWSIIGRHVKLVSFALFNIRFFAKYNNNLLGLRIVPRETENNGYAKSFFLGGGGGWRGGGRGDYHGIFQSGEWYAV